MMKSLRKKALAFLLPSIAIGGVVVTLQGAVASDKPRPVATISTPVTPDEAVQASTPLPRPDPRPALLKEYGPQRSVEVYARQIYDAFVNIPAAVPTFVRDMRERACLKLRKDQTCADEAGEKNEKTEEKRKIALAIGSTIRTLLSENRVFELIHLGRMIRYDPAVELKELGIALDLNPAQQPILVERLQEGLDDAKVEQVRVQTEHDLTRHAANGRRTYALYVLEEDVSAGKARIKRVEAMLQLARAFKPPAPRPAHMAERKLKQSSVKFDAELRLKSLEP